MEAGLIGTMDEDSKLKKRKEKGKRGKGNIVANMGDLATAVDQGFYVAGARGGGTCSPAGSATAAT
jgi:hypothetical protein